MKTAVGCDIEDISRFEDRPDAFLRKIYTAGELAYCLSKKRPAKHLAARFCAKEAVVKALCALGIEGVFYADVDILRAENGVPSVRLTKDVGVSVVFSLSLSHSKTTAMATVLATING
jgi:phosphopantetheine--protein transferase-like protein